jgi:hypothetical protein
MKLTVRQLREMLRSFPDHATVTCEIAVEGVGEARGHLVYVRSEILNGVEEQACIVAINPSKYGWDPYVPIAVEQLAGDSRLFVPCSCEIDACNPHCEVHGLPYERCTRCGMTRTEVAQAFDAYCTATEPHPDGDAQQSQHFFPSDRVRR